jgi:hypothetical protein
LAVRIAGTGYFPVMARQAALLAIKNNGEGVQVDYEHWLRLPASLESFEKTTWSSSGWLELPVTVKPLDTNAEKDIIDALIAEINTKYSLNLDLDIKLSRNQTASQPRVVAAPTIVVVGASNSARLSALIEEFGATVHRITVPGWHPNTTVIQEAADQLNKITFQDPDTSLIVLYNLDSAVYRAVQEDDTLIPARQLEGRNHLDGELVITLIELFHKTLKICTPLLQLHPEILKLVLAPSPRYWLSKCCTDPDHIPNFSQPEYEEDMMSGLAGLRRAIKDHFFMQCIPKLRVINPLLVFGDSTGRTASAECLQAVKDIWGDDPVHPSLECMSKLTSHILDMVLGDNEDSASITTISNEVPKQPTRKPKGIKPTKVNIGVEVHFLLILCDLKWCNYEWKMCKNLSLCGFFKIYPF